MGRPGFGLPRGVFSGLLSELLTGGLLSELLTGGLLSEPLTELTTEPLTGWLEEPRRV